MEILEKCFVNNTSLIETLIENISSNEMVEISWGGGYDYKRINKKEERIENKDNEANLYVDSA